jgi:hypothetical protein
VLPGYDPLTGERQSVIRGVSPRKMVALYEDPAEDDWPEYALRILDTKGDEHRVRLYDAEGVYEFTVSGSGREITQLETPAPHNAGVCPVVRYANMLDLDGRTPGEVEPFIALAAKINKTAYDRLLVQHFNSWKIRYVTGMAEPDDEQAANRTKLKLRQDDLLIAEDPDTKFGQLDETSLGGFIDAHKADIETLAAASARRPRMSSPGSWRIFRPTHWPRRAPTCTRRSLSGRRRPAQPRADVEAGCGLDGHDDYARDITGRVTWQDMEIRSMSQAADALVKMGTIGIPLKSLWGKIPGVDKADVDEWARAAEEGDPIRRMQLELEAEFSQPRSGGTAATPGDLPAPESLPNG